MTVYEGQDTGSREVAGGRPRFGFARFGRMASSLLLVALSAFVGGFLVFADKVVNSRPPARPSADGIVALTGGPSRIEDAVALLDRGSAERLLISGVDERTSARALANRSPQLASLIKCCIDIGYEANDTRGNALETRKWAERQGYGSLIVVTSAYHMPRSLAEIARELPEVDLVPYPIRPDMVADWHSDLPTFKLLLTEYVKYLVVRLA